jgi:hypothetical protein
MLFSSPASAGEGDHEVVEGASSAGLGPLRQHRLRSLPPPPLRKGGD